MLLTEGATGCDGAKRDGRGSVCDDVLTMVGEGAAAGAGAPGPSRDPAAVGALDTAKRLVLLLLAPPPSEPLKDLSAVEERSGC